MTAKDRANFQPTRNRTKGQPTLTEIKRAIYRRQWSYARCRYTLDGAPAFRVGERVLTWSEMSTEYVMGLI